MFDFDKRLSRLADASVLCVGDLMLDAYVYGEVSRVSPEAPAMVIAATRERSRSSSSRCSCRASRA